MYASRNITLCNKDCLCLFVCPTGATDTPTGQIDAARCIDGCRKCVDACPSGAIYLVSAEYPEPAPKGAGIRKSLLDLCASKTDFQAIAESIAADGNRPEGERLLARALALSSRILAEDCAREADFLHHKCKASRKLIGEVDG